SSVPPDPGRVTSPLPSLRGASSESPPQSTPAAKTNTLAVVAFVLSLLCVLPLIPMILGIVAIRQIRARGEKGTGLAVAAIILNGITVVLAAGVLWGGLSDEAPRRDGSGEVTRPGSGGTEDIRAGDCFNTPDDMRDYDASGAPAAPSVDIVPCGQPHDGEAFAVFTVEDGDGAFPGADRIRVTAEQKCGETALAGYRGTDAPLPESLELYYYLPTESSWDDGGRKVTCFVGDPAGQRTGSIRPSGS
ncbi:DUF4190 domain-containing protein, partial [Streptomyces sp. WAC05292]|uniref:DUF4190 domain-containing protein n=1 Tax=Streptomyces sp. WAC05292 TaxID=2487418 RepID=UPI001C8E26D3